MQYYLVAPSLVFLNVDIDGSFSVRFSSDLLAKLKLLFLQNRKDFHLGSTGSAVRRSCCPATVRSIEVSGIAVPRQEVWSFVKLELFCHGVRLGFTLHPGARTIFFDMRRPGNALAGHDHSEMADLATVGAAS